MSESGYRRPVFVSSDDFNHSRIRTVVAAVLTTNLWLAQTPGNVLVGVEETGLSRDSVVNVSQIVTVDKSFLAKQAGSLGSRPMLVVEDGLSTVLVL